mgnify:FL=1|tara:strand:+ start:526 stop:3654 length:3129 start_codon:yes stop_codon:yes gene_type:complete
MAAINQRIPNFLGGVSQQPDKIKFPGQLRSCHNAVPDITFGLKKRPPGEFVGTLTNATSTGHWYEILRDGDEKYLVQITPANSGSMPIRVWDLSNGNQQTVLPSAGSNVYSYLANATEAYGLTTIQDYTLIANPQKTVAEGTSLLATALDGGNYSFVRLDTIAYNTEYVLYDTTNNTVGNPPTPNTYYRVTSLKVDFLGPPATGTNAINLAGSTWGNPDAGTRYAASAPFSFSGGDNVQLTGNLYTDHLNNALGASNVLVNGENITENIEGNLQVNGVAYIASNTANFNNNTGASADFLGYTQDYDNRYTATITLKNGGLIRSTSKTTAESLYVTVITSKGTPNEQKYRISVEAVEEVQTYRDVTGIGYFKTPKNPDQGVLSMSTILKGLRDSVNNSSNGLANVNAETVGSGLYLNGTSAKNVNFLGGSVNENMSVISTTAQDVSRLPNMNKHGYTVQVSNTAELDTDDYYLKFVADNGVSGSGSYEECLRPHNFNGTAADQTIKLGLDASTMPHALINNRNGTFTFTKLDFASRGSTENYWKDRDVGDNTSNPMPSIVGKQISNLFFHRNRLGLIADEQIVMSRPGSYFNLFIVSAIAASDDNPIDISVSDVKPAFINHTLPINKGVMMFSDNAQFLLFTESDIFSPKTVRLKKISSYECDSTIQPVDLGTSVLFTSSVSAYARAFEAVVIDDDAPAQIIEQTRVVPEFLPKDITMSSNSASIGITTYAKKGDSFCYHYKYYNADNKREQSAWYTWNTPFGTYQHMFYTGGNFFAVVYHNGSYKLCRHEYVTDTTSDRSYTITDGSTISLGDQISTDRSFEAHLEHMTIPSSIAGYSQSTTEPARSVVTVPYTVGSSPVGFYMVGLSGTDAFGESIAGVHKAADSSSGNTATFENIVLHSSNSKIAVGYLYITQIELPTYYVNLGQNAYDTNGDLRISGINFEIGEGGHMLFTLKNRLTYVDSAGNVVKDIEDYVQEETGIITDYSKANTHASQLTKSVRVPIQRKNDKYILDIYMNRPFSTALISASWDGIYNTKRHVRR